VILIPLFGSDTDSVGLRAGLAVSQRFGAHAEGLFVRVDPADVIPPIGEGGPVAGGGHSAHAGGRGGDGAQSEAARGAFEAAFQESGIALADNPGRAAAASARWIELTERRDEVIPRKARVSDLTVLAWPHEEAPPELDAVLEATLFGAGRPLLIVPPAGAREFGRTVAITWDGGTEAARGRLGAAVPGRRRRSSLPDRADPAHSRGRRGRPGRVSSVARDRLRPARGSGRGGPAGGGCPVAHRERDRRGPAGHGRLRRARLNELVFGGVTRHVLAKPELPLLISH
jgi:hypothetical protein